MSNITQTRSTPISMFNSNKLYFLLEYNTDYQLDPNESQKLIEEAKNDIEVDLINLKKLQQQNGPNNNNSVTSNEDNHIEEQDADLIEEDAIREEHCQQLEKDISDLILKIDIKRRLINELELNSKNLEQMRVHYQEKMSLLHDRIKQVEEERDKIILNMSKCLFLYFLIHKVHLVFLL